MDPFSKIDLILASKCPDRKSLCPGRDVATSFERIGIQLRSFAKTEEDWEYAAEITSLVAYSALNFFPKNIYWDFDYLIGRLAHNAHNSPDNFQNKLRESAEKVINIFSIFGNESSIKFRYVHDFMYGFDWLKWMLEKKGLLDDPDPFGDDFLDYISLRGNEMLELIKNDDRDYPELDGVYRNPFLFARTDKDELLLSGDLAVSKNIPIEAWDMAAIPKYDKNYSLIRLMRSREMGISRNEMPGSHKI